MRRWLLVLCTLMCLAATGDDQPRLKFLNPKAFWRESEKLPIEVRVDHRPENRALIVAAFDEGGEQVSLESRDLDGKTDALVYRFEWYLPGGDLELVAVALGERQHQLARIAQPITVQAKIGP